MEGKAVRHRTAERKGSLEIHHGKYRIVAMVNGHRITQSTGTAKRREAERIRRVFMAQFLALDAVSQAEKLADAVRLAKDKAEEASRRAEEVCRPALRIPDALDAYMNDPAREPTTKGTDNNTRFSFLRFVRWLAKRHPTCEEVRQVTPSMAEEYCKDLCLRLSPGTAGRHIAILNRIWKVVGERARCTLDPWTKIKKRSGVSHRRENFTKEQIEAIFAKLEPGTEFHALCTIGRYTGLRLSDAATIKWSSIDFAAGIIELVPLKVKKYGKPVRIPIHESLRSVLVAIPKEGEYVLPKLAGDYKRSPSILTTKMAKLLRAVGLETNEKLDGYVHKVAKYGFHSFRSSFVSMCAEMGVPLSVVQELVGHQSQELTQHYFHLGDEAARKAIATLPGFGATAATIPANVEAVFKELSSMGKDDLLAIRDKIDTLLAG